MTSRFDDERPCAECGMLTNAGVCSVCRAELAGASVVTLDPVVLLQFMKAVVSVDETEAAA